MVNSHTWLMAITVVKYRDFHSPIKLLAEDLEHWELKWLRVEEPDSQERSLWVVPSSPAWGHSHLFITVTQQEIITDVMITRWAGNFSPTVDLWGIDWLSPLSDPSQHPSSPQLHYSISMLCSMGSHTSLLEGSRDSRRRGNVLEGGSLSLSLGHGIEKGSVYWALKINSLICATKMKMVNTKSVSFCPLPCVWAQDPDRLHPSRPLPSSSGKLMVWEARPAGLVTGP